jgi:predicted NBD/HSP70 family sugar kinase
MEGPGFVCSVNIHSLNLRWKPFLSTETRHHPALTPLSTRAKATRSQTRSNNLRLALQIIYSEGPTSRAHVARASHLTPATASALVDELIDVGLVIEAGTGPSAGGKPPKLVAPNPEGRSIIALDISSSQFQGAVVDLSGDLVTTESVTAATGDAAITTVIEMISTLAAESPAPLLGVGIGTPGVVDPANGVVTSANLDWHEAPLGARLRGQIEGGVHITNDAQAAALHEYSVHAPEVSSLALVQVGRGIGTGHVLDGHLFHGENKTTGEIGHVRLDDGGRRCSCGNTGCLETQASMSALLHAVGGDQGLTHERIAEVAADPGARLAIDAAAIALGRGLAPMVALLASRKIVLWGEVTSLDDAYRRLVESEIRSRVLPVNTDQIEVRFATAGGDAVIRGAAALVLSSELGVVW